MRGAAQVVEEAVDHLGLGDSQEGRIVRGLSLARVAPSGGPMRLTAWGKRVIVAASRFPFRAVVVNPIEDRVEFAFQPQSMFDREDYYGAHVAMPVLPVPPGFLQVYADLGSDDRVFLVYGQDGSFSRMSQLEAPFALVAHRMDSRRLLAVRRAGPTEVVGYQWRWK